MKLSETDMYTAKVRSQQGFSSKVLGIALVATLVPTLVLSITLVGSHRPDSIQGALTLILFTVLAVAGLAFWEIRNLLRPVEVLTTFVDNFVRTGEIVDVPEEMDHELGGLIRNTRNAIVKLDLANRELAVVSKLDLLTGLPNRGFGSQKLEEDLARADRSRTSVTMISIDIDDFKRLNDKYGLGVGDACLRFYADLAKSCLREGDWIARWGADEFLILLWDATTSNADDVINRIRYKLSNSQDVHDAGIQLTASYGYATHLPGERTYELFARTEGALHRAKRFGRNQSSGSGSVDCVNGVRPSGR